MASLDQCPISSIRCRNRNIGDGTPLLRLWRGVLAEFLHAVGWVLGTVALFVLVLPNVLRRFVQTIFGYIKKSVDDGIVRIVGLRAVVFGLALICVGVYVV